MQNQLYYPSCTTFTQCENYIRLLFNLSISLLTNETKQYNSVMIPNNTKQQAYQLDINQNMKWTIKANYYPGFLRALETFSQLFQKNSNKSPDLMYTIQHLPILIKDEPNYPWRGVMIDSSRHFLPVATIKHTIDGMLFNKLNVLHWHIIDQESFPMEVSTRPQLSGSGQIAGTYSNTNIQEIINYAKIRGIRVIPQIDSPAHTQSWGRNEKLKQIIVNCTDPYQGQFDPTINLTYEVVTDVMKYIKDLFPDNYVHFGGDQVQYDCWDKKPSIKTWMKNNNISNYQQLSIYYRKKQKQLWRQISNKNVIYWANQQINLPIENDDIIQWWGVSSNVNKLIGKTNQVILANYDKTYMDVGFGNCYGDHYLTYITWRNAYGLNLKIKDVNIIGAQSALWSQLNNQFTQDRKLWIRTCAIAQRLWNHDIDYQTSQANIVYRLVAQAKRMKERGFKVSAVSVGLCQKYPEICFNGKH